MENHPFKRESVRGGRRDSLTLGLVYRTICTCRFREGMITVGCNEDDLCVRSVCTK